MRHLRMGNSFEHLRAEARGGVDDYASNPDLLVLRKLIEEEMEHDSSGEACTTPPGVGSSFFSPGRFSADRRAATGWAAEARLHNFRAHQQVLCAPEASPAAVDDETARQVEVSEQAITSSWLSRLFGLGGFQTDDRKRRASKHPAKAPPKAAPPTRKHEHWIPEREFIVNQVESQAPELSPPGTPPDVAHAAVEAKQAQQTAPALTDMLKAVVPDILQLSTPEQWIVSSLGLVLSANKDTEVVFVRALPNSPADALLEADAKKMLEGDVLFAVDGENVYKLPMRQLVEKLGGAADTVVTLHFLRGQPKAAGQEQSIQNDKSKRVFVTLIRADPTGKVINEQNDPNKNCESGAPNCHRKTQDNSSSPASNWEIAAKSKDRTASMFDFGIEIESESQASQRLGRHPLLSELRLEKGEGGAVRNADENVLGADRMKKTLRLGTGSTVSKDIDDEMRALKNRLSTRGRLSLGDSMLRSVDASMDPMGMLLDRHEEQVALQLKKAAAEAREQYRELSKVRNALKEEAVDKVRDFAKEWGDRERRICQYLGLVRREEGKASSLQEAIDGALTQHKDSTRALVLATYKAHTANEANKGTKFEGGYPSSTRSRSEKASDNFEKFLSNMSKENADKKARAEKGHNATAGASQAEEQGELPIYEPISPKAKSAGFAALKTQKGYTASPVDSKNVSIRSEDEDVSSDEDSEKQQWTELSSRSRLHLDLKSAGKHASPSPPVSTPAMASSEGLWTVHVMVYELENLPKTDVFGNVNPYACLSLLREDAERSVLRKYSISHNRDRNRKDPHYCDNSSYDGQLYKVNAEHMTRTKSNRSNASYQEEFRFYSSQASPAHCEAILNGSPVWLLVTVWNDSTRGADKLVGKIIVELSANGDDAPPSAEVNENQWRTLVDEDGRAVLGSDGSAARILLAAKYVKGDFNASFTPLS